MVLEWSHFYPHMPNQFITFPSHGWNLVCLSLMNSVGFTLMTLWDPASPQRSAGTQQGAAILGIPLNFYWVASDPALAPNLSLWTPFAPTWWLTENLPHVTPIPQEDLSVTEPNRQLAGGGKQTQISGCLGPLADLSSGLVLVESSFGVQLGPSNTHPGQAEAVTNCGKLQKCFYWPVPEFLPRGPRNNIPSGQVKTSDQQWMG